jgi:hypothetical protein
MRERKETGGHIKRKYGKGIEREKRKKGRNIRRRAKRERNRKVTTIIIYFKIGFY